MKRVISRLRHKLRIVGDRALVRREAFMPLALERRLVAAYRRRPRVVVPVTEGRQRLFVDVSVVAGNDAGTGIQRVVRGIASHIAELADDRWDVRFVAADRATPYRTINWKHSPRVEDSRTISARPGDVFLGLDYSLDAIASHWQQLAELRRDGARLWFLVHDLLPLQRPEWFSDQTSLRYRRWLRILASVADGFLCNSSQTETDLVEALRARYGLTEDFRTCVLPMGADLISSEDDGRRDLGSEQIPPGIAGSPFVLMVGTLEPRKGHEQVLSAFEALWPTENTALVLVGRPGWKIERLQSRIEGHPLLGKKLFWLNDASDRTLERMYHDAQGVIVAALAEGFGLPLIEALANGKPVLARDLPVFRQHEQHGVRFFPDHATSGQIAQSIEGWLSEIRAGKIRVTSPGGSWKSTTGALLEALSTG